MELRQLPRIKGTHKVRQTDFSEKSEVLSAKVSEDSGAETPFTKTKENNKNIVSKSQHNKKVKNIHEGHRQRLKNQFIENSALTDIQKIELLLFYSIPQKDTNPIAHELLNHFGSLKGILTADYDSLMQVNGIKENSVCLIKLINNLYSSISMPDKTEEISSVSLAKKFCSKLYVGSSVEQFYVICLTKNNKIQKVKMIETGSSDEVSVQIRTITEMALSCKSNRIIVSHNHPNGNSTMSDEDFSFTYSLVCSCLLNSIDLLDHIIVGTNDSTTSLAEKRILQRIKEKSVKSINISREKFMLISNSSKEYVID